jgi:hypothetical protein
MGAYAQVRIGRTRPFKIASRVYTLARAGAKTIPLPFARGQLRAVRSALTRRVRVVATVFGVVFGGSTGKRIVESSPSKQFVVR